jgi:hypothetical protein
MACSRSLTPPAQKTFKLIAPGWRSERPLTVLRVNFSNARVTHSGQHQAAIVWLPLVLVLPILAFAIVPSLFGRLVVIVLIGAAGLKQVTSTPELMSFMTIQAWSVAASM